MKEGTRNLWVGVFVITSFGVLGGMMFLFGEAPSWLGGSEWTLRITDVSELNGLSEGGPVLLNGVEIGRVKRLEFEDPTRPHQGVVIVAGIKNTFTVPEGAVARVYGVMFGLGAGHVEIICEPVSGVEPLGREMAAIQGSMGNAFGEWISAEFLTSVETAVQNIGDLAGATEPVMQNLHALSEQRSVAEVDRPGPAGQKPVPTISTVVERLDGLLASLDKVVGDELVQSNAIGAVSDLRSAASELRRAIQVFGVETRRTSENLNTGIDDTKQNLQESFVVLNRTLENLDDGLTTLARLLRHVESGEGTAGRFIHDDRLYEAAVISLERFGELAATLQRMLGKAEDDGYITIGKATPIGILRRNVPLGEIAEKLQDKFSRPSKG